MQVACEFGSGRSAWPMSRRLANVRHSAEELLWNIGNSIRSYVPSFVALHLTYFGGLV